MSATVEAPVALVPAVLVVDDEPVMRALLEELLSRMGLGVALAASGAQAVEVYRSRHGAFALVLVDLRMRGMDGLATLAALRRIDPAVRCCLMSGNPAELGEVACLPGVTALLEKPFQPDLFEATVRVAMSG
jgi:CheY-like chemotaxis protein